MENKKVTGKMIICTINGKEREVQVRKHASYTVRKTTAEFIASQVMDSDEHRLLTALRDSDGYVRDHQLYGF